jgi:hypothetical protein
LNIAGHTTATVGLDAGRIDIVCKIEALASPMLRGRRGACRGMSRPPDM